MRRAPGIARTGGSPVRSRTRPRSLRGSRRPPAADRGGHNGPAAHPEDDAGIAERALEPHRAVESGSLELAADPGDSDWMVEARANARERHEDEQGPETGRQGDEQRAEAE